MINIDLIIHYTQRQRDSESHGLQADGWLGCLKMDRWWITLTTLEKPLNMDDLWAGRVRAFAMEKTNCCRFRHTSE